MDAYFGHDTFLVGMVAQDPGLRIVPQGDLQHYGIAVGPGQRHARALRQRGPGPVARGRHPGAPRTNGGWGRSTAVPASRCPPCRCPTPRGSRTGRRRHERAPVDGRRDRDGRARRSGGVLVAVERRGLPVARRADRSHHHDGGAVDRDHHGAHDVRPRAAELRARPHAAHPDGRCHPEQERPEARGGRRPGHAATGATATRATGRSRASTSTSCVRSRWPSSAATPTTSPAVQDADHGRAGPGGAVGQGRHGRQPPHRDVRPLERRRLLDRLLRRRTRKCSSRSTRRCTACHRPRGEDGVRDARFHVDHEHPAARSRRRRSTPSTPAPTAWSRSRTGRSTPSPATTRSWPASRPRRSATDTRLLGQPLEPEPYAIAIAEGPRGPRAVRERRARPDAERRLARGAVSVSGSAMLTRRRPAAAGVRAMTMTIADLDRDLDALPERRRHREREPARARRRPQPPAARDRAAHGRPPPASGPTPAARSPRSGTGSPGSPRSSTRPPSLRVSPRTRLAPGRERALADFLSEPSIELGSDAIPLRDRDLLQARRATSRCTADELLALMSDAFARAREVVAGSGAAWDELVPRLAATHAPRSTDVSGGRAVDQVRTAARRPHRGTGHRSARGHRGRGARRRTVGRRADPCRRRGAGRCATSGRNGCERPAPSWTGSSRRWRRPRSAHATTTAEDPRARRCPIRPWSTPPSPPTSTHVVGLADAGHWDDAVAHARPVVDDPAATRRRGCAPQRPPAARR